MPALPENISEVVTSALQEDIGSGDCTAELIKQETSIKAHLISREDAILCGTAWFSEVFRQLDPSVQIKWFAQDADNIEQNQQLCNLYGSAQAILTGERTAINFLQTLSGTATVTNEYVELIAGCKTKLLDTRKTIPGLRTAQKYAVLCGGGQNHRMGLYDAILIKENHITASGSIAAAVKKAKAKNVPVEVEVETLSELEEALSADCDSVLLDNFSLDNLCEAVRLNNGRIKLEASGGIDKANIRSIAETGVDFISIGSLTKHVRAIDFSMRFE